MSSPAFPGALDALANPGPTTETDDAGYELDIVVARLQNCIMAIEGKLGIGAGGPPASAGVLRRTATGSSGWGPIVQGDITAGQISQSWAVAPAPSSAVGFSGSSAWFDLGTLQLALTNLTTGSIVLYAFSVTMYSAPAFGRLAFRLVRGDTNAQIGQHSTTTAAYAGAAVANWDLERAGAGYFVSPVTGSLTVKLQGSLIDTAVSTAVNANSGFLACVELRR